MSCPPTYIVCVSPGELETCRCIVSKPGKEYQDANHVIIVPGEKFPRCRECLKPDRTLNVCEYRWVSFTYRYTLMTLLRRGTKLTSTEQRDLRSCTTVVLRRPPRQNDAPPRAIAPKDWPPMALLGRAAHLLPSQCPPGARCLRVACALSPRFRRGNGMMVPVLRRPESPCCQWHHRETCGLANGARA